jgi:hypothetical protein
MKAYAFAAIAALSAASLAGCNTTQTQQASVIVAEACAVAGVASAVIASDGTIVGTTSAQQAEIQKGQQLVTVNCAAAQAGIAALAAAMSSTPAPTPTALVAIENEQAAKMHISPELLRKVMKRYEGK